jgi:replicative DNA helicase
MTDQPSLGVSGGSPAEALDFDDTPYESGAPLTLLPQPSPSRRPRREQAGRIPPHNIEAEEYLLSCCLMDGASTLSQAEAAGVTSRTFYNAAHSLMFERLRQMNIAGKPIDLLTVSQEMIAKRELEQVGGYPYLLQISSSIPTTAQADYFIEKIRDAEKRREVILRATALVEEAYSHAGDGLTEALATPITQLQSVVSGPVDSRRDARPISKTYSRSVLLYH